MAQVPANPRLWSMLTAQARARFRVYPSPAASHWVHKEYVQKGGRFVDTRRSKEKPLQRQSNSDDQYEDRKGKDDDPKGHEEHKK